MEQETSQPPPSQTLYTILVANAVLLSCGGHGMRELTAGARKENCFCRESRSPPRYSQEVDSYVCPLSSTADLKSLAELSPKFLEISAGYDGYFS